MSGPPPLRTMRDRQKRLEAARADLYAQLHDALVAADGVVGRAGAALWPDITPGSARNRAHTYLRRFELVEFAAALRIKATGRARGRQDRGKK